jgi:hypothetical protein
MKSNAVWVGLARPKSFLIRSQVQPRPTASADPGLYIGLDVDNEGTA